MIAVIPGPSCTGALPPCGPLPQLVAPHVQRRAMSWCSTTRTVIGGRSNTWGRSIPTSGADARSSPQPVHEPGSCRRRSFGLSTNANVDPGCPACPPGLRPLGRRSDFGAGFVNGESDEGGFDELVEFIPNHPDRRARPHPGLPLALVTLAASTPTPRPQQPLPASAGRSTTGITIYGWS